MRREEKRRKFHEAVLNTLYPPAPSPPPQAEDQDENPVNAVGEDFDVGLINPDDYLGSSTSNSDDDDDDGEGSECRPEMLTRAQRKRLRKKTLKEDAKRRRNIIGPLLPTKSDADEKVCGGGGEIGSPGIRKNASMECAVPSDKSPPGELTGSSNQKKLKHRRMAKRLAREQLKLSSSETNREDQNFESSHEKENCGQDKKE